MSGPFQKPPVNTKFTSFGREKREYEPPKNTYMVGQRRQFGGKKSKGGVGGSWTKSGVTSKLSGGNASNWISKGGNSGPGGWGVKTGNKKAQEDKKKPSGGFMDLIKPKEEVADADKDELTEEDIERLYSILDYDDLDQEV